MAPVLRQSAMAAMILLVGGGHAPAQVFTPDEKVPLAFSTNWNTGFGLELFVVGNHPDLGDWNPVAARKLRWTEGNVWTGTVAVTAGNALEYKFIVRTNSGTDYCSSANVTWMPDPNLVTSTPARAGAPVAGKTIYYYSGWTNAMLLYRNGSDTNWLNAGMQAVGPGRSPGEQLYRAEGVGRTGDMITYVPHGFAAGNPVEQWDNCPIAWIQDYFTRLDAFVLQDGHIYNYWPPASRSASSITTHFISSSYTPQAPSRNIQIYLPRNYTQNPAKRYPVLYLHDGQNVFQPGNPDFGCWDAEVSADDMISLGLMRETILVAVDNTSERNREYIPPTDAPDGTGTADRYLGFVVNNVKPFVDTNYRTLPDRENTGVLGSSFGGVASLYFGLATNVFGKIGPMSTSFWAIPNFYGRSVVTGDTSGLRIYADMGTGDGDVDEFDALWRAYDQFLIDGHVPNDTLRIEVGCGHPHSEWAWADRVYMAFMFLFNARDEANRIQQDECPPVLLPASPTGPPQLAFTGWKGWEYVLQRSPALVNPVWAGVATARVESLMWAAGQLGDPGPAAGGTFHYRLFSRVRGE